MSQSIKWKETGEDLYLDATHKKPPYTHTFHTPPHTYTHMHTYTTDAIKFHLVCANNQMVFKKSVLLTNFTLLPLAPAWDGFTYVDKPQSIPPRNGGLDLWGIKQM